jgi:hypothetical protein
VSGQVGRIVLFVAEIPAAEGLKMKDLIKAGSGYTYKGYVISKAKKGSKTGFSCSIYKSAFSTPLTLKTIVSMIDQKVGA